MRHCRMFRDAYLHVKLGALNTSDKEVLLWYAQVPRDDYTRDLPHLSGEYLGRNIGSNRRAAYGALEASLQPSSTKAVGPLLVYLHPSILFLGSP